MDKKNLGLKVFVYVNDFGIALYIILSEHAIHWSFFESIIIIIHQFY